MATKTLFPLLCLSIISFSTSLPTETLEEAADILSNSGYLSMALILQLVSDSVIPRSPSLTIFSPSDSSFSESGQPSLSLLKFHLSPLSFHLDSLKSLPRGSQIPTFLTNHSLTLTSSSYSESDITVFLNDVKITDSLYDDGSLVILGIEKFLDPEFKASVPIIEPIGGGNLGCSLDSRGVAGGGSSFTEAAMVLRSKDCSIMASFLELQLLGFMEQPLLTIFAPIDEVMNGYVGYVDLYSSIFLRHVLPCKIVWKDMVSLEDGMVLDTYGEGFGIKISKSGDIVMLNEVPVCFPDLYQNEWLVVHGIRGLLGDQQENGDGEF